MIVGVCIPVSEIEEYGKTIPVGQIVFRPFFTVSSSGTPYIFWTEIDVWETPGTVSRLSRAKSDPAQKSVEIYLFYP